MNSNVINSSMTKNESAIKTLAFFDLETTGLPELEFYKTKITELSIIACSVEHFLEHGTAVTPRVQHKLTLCFNPFKRIDLKATEVTGLTNELLEHVKKFDKHSMNLLESFLSQLQPPVCLIAHNGNNFDFPLIKKIYENYEGAYPSSMKCCDSLLVFKRIDEIKVQNEQNIMEDAQTINVNTNGATKCESSMALKNNESDQILKEASNKTEPQDEMQRMQKINETTPNQPTKSTNGIGKPDFSSPTRDHLKRELFPKVPIKKKSFALREVFKRTFNSYPENSHDAESDVMSLLKSAHACKKDFIEALNELSVSFCDIKRF